MMRAREIRLWTALVVAGLAALAMAQGSVGLTFGVVEMQVDAGSTALQLQPFVNDGLVGDLAARDWLRDASPTSPQARVEIIGRLLSRAPLNGGAWLDLAIARRAAGASTESVAAALALSTVTTPNEAHDMAGRIAFAAPFWSVLPPDARRALIADLVGGWGALGGAQRARLTAIFAEDHERSREEVRAALLLNGAAGAAIVNALMPRPQDASQGTKATFTQDTPSR